MAKNKITTAKEVGSKGPGSYTAGLNLILKVKKTSSRSWVFRYQAGDKVIDIGLGTASKGGHSLAEAKAVAAEMKRAVLKGENPRSKLKPKLVEAPLSFKVYAADFITRKESEHRSLKAHAQWTSTIAAYCGDIAHKTPVEITYQDVDLLVRQPSLSGKRETASRVLQRVRNILDYAAKREGQPGRFNPALAVRLPKCKPSERAKHFAAAPYADVPAIVAALREKDCTSALVLRWSIATAARSGNARGLLWADVNIDEAVLSIPGERMKSGEPFSQPLNAEALAVLELAKMKAGNSERVFPGPHGGLISDVAINKLLKGIYPNITAHGFRSSFRDWGAEQTKFPAEAFEQCLAHIQTNKVIAAYHRTKLFDIRRIILADWNSYCNGKSIKSA